MEVNDQYMNTQHALNKQSEVEIGMKLKDKMAELVTTREQIDRSRETAMQSYLESKPLIARLEKSTANLEKARSRRSMNGGILSSDLLSQLEAIEAVLREKKEEEAKAARSVAEMTWAVEKARSEIDSLKAATEEERRTRKKLKRALRVKRQKLRAIHLMLRAVRIESEAIKVSLEYAVQQANLAKTEVTVMQLDQEEYWALRRRAEEEESQAEGRIAASVKQKAAAQESRNLALRRLMDVKEGIRTRRRTGEVANQKKIDNREKPREEENKKEEEEAYGQRRQEVITYGRGETAIARTKELTEIRNGMRPRRVWGDNKKKVVNKKKQSIFAQIRMFFAKRFARMFR